MLEKYNLEYFFIKSFDDSCLIVRDRHIRPFDRLKFGWFFESKISSQKKRIFSIASYLKSELGAV